MKKWKGTVVVSYTQEITVEAETQAEAEDLMLDLLDPAMCWTSEEGRVYDVQEMSDEEKGESK